ncbi:MAG: hypothetical protein JSW51_00045 [Gemmatimonadota bacterium]|nr:MAG: hypothetical protein JSW51_00045 [Gemmatimonadota bacterium]
MKHPILRHLHSMLMCLLFAGACSGGAQYGKVELGELVVAGQVDPEYLYLQLRQLDPTFEACYVRALRRDRDAEGVVDLELNGSDGKLTPAITTNGTGSENLAECITTAITGLTIVEPEGSDPWSFSGDWSVTFEIIRQ